MPQNPHSIPPQINPLIPPAMPPFPPTTKPWLTPSPDHTRRQSWKAYSKESTSHETSPSNVHLLATRATAPRASWWVSELLRCNADAGTALLEWAAVHAECIPESRAAVGYEDNPTTQEWTIRFTTTAHRCIPVCNEATLQHGLM